jgi:hypothetical protein
MWSMSGAGVGGQHAHPSVEDLPRLARQRRGGRLPVGLGARFDPFGGQPDPGQIGQQIGCGGERRHGGDPGTMRRSPGDSDAPSTPSWPSRHDPALAGRAVVGGATDPDAAQHGIDVLVPLADEPVHSRPPAGADAGMRRAP